MACGNVGNIKIEPVNVYWKMKEQWCFDFAKVTASGIGGQYVTLNRPTGEAYYAWFDENNTDVDPAPSGKTAIAVDYAASASVAAIALAFKNAVDAIAGFKAVVDGTHVIVTCTAYGDATDFTVGTATSIVATKLAEGRDFYLGLLDGDVESTFEEQLLEVTAHQTGATKIADLRQGFSAEIALTLKEADQAKLKEMFGKVAGGVVTPMGGTEVFGWGTAKIGSNTIVEAGRLILHPVRLSDSDYSEDLCFWRAYPVPESIVFSGENPKVVSVNFQIYKDEDIDSSINLFAFGDWTQYEIED